jgi:hypothetical protein
MRSAMKALKERMIDAVDARDVEYGTLLSLPPNSKVKVDGTPDAYDQSELIFADYLLKRKMNGIFQIGDGPVSEGYIEIDSPLQVGDELLMIRMVDQKYYVLGRLSK